jgi:hypothetical protein
MNSDPTLKDTDYDGIDDNIDANSVYGGSNEFKGIMHGYSNVGYGKVDFKVNYRKFFNNNEKYQKDLAVLSSLYAEEIYDDKLLEITSQYKNGKQIREDSIDKSTSTIEILLSKLGMNDIRKYDLRNCYIIDKDDITEFAIGHRLVEFNGQKKEIIAVIIRGTNGTIEEWSSNFDVGASSTEYYEATGDNHSDWSNKQNHKGFDVTANRVIGLIQNDYFKNVYLNQNAQKAIWITGHSRGAAIANLVGAHYEKETNFESFTYTFAAPNTTTSITTDDYKTIFNIVNEDDIIPCLPLESWGFKKYGITKSVSIRNNYEKIINSKGSWEEFTGIGDYNHDGGIIRTIKEFEKIANNRENLYSYSNDTKTFTETIEYCTNIDDAINNSKTYYGDRLYQFCKLEQVYDESYYNVGLGENIYIYIYRLVYKQTPAFFMMTLSDLAANTGGRKSGMLTGFAVAPKYENAKLSFMVSSGKIPIPKLGGMEHPHWLESYYIIAKNDKYE